MASHSPEVDNYPFSTFAEGENFRFIHIDNVKGYRSFISFITNNGEGFDESSISPENNPIGNETQSAYPAPLSSSEQERQIDFQNFYPAP